MDAYRYLTAHAEVKKASLGEINGGVDDVTYANLNEYIELLTTKLLVDNVREYAQEIRAGSRSPCRPRRYQP